MGVEHHLAQLAQQIVVLPVQIEQPHVQLGHIHHLTGLFACRTGAVCGRVSRVVGGSLYPLQQVLHLVVHTYTPPY